jgi:hypothetical protein
MARQIIEAKMACEVSSVPLSLTGHRCARAEGPFATAD